MAKALYTETQRQAVIGRARQAVSGRLAGRHSMILGGPVYGQEFLLDVGGYCNRFIRQAFETALGRKPFSWYFGAKKAYQTLAKLEKYRVPLASRQPGDILGFAGDPGHIALYLGRTFDATKELVAENTSSGTRGYPLKPGTKVTRYSALASRVQACYRLFG